MTLANSLSRLLVLGYKSMRIAKPLLLVTTPIGVLGGLYECVKLAGGLVFIMLAMVGVMLAALGTVVATIRREAEAARAARDVDSKAADDRCKS